MPLLGMLLTMVILWNRLRLISDLMLMVMGSTSSLLLKMSIQVMEGTQMFREE